MRSRLSSFHECTASSEIQTVFNKYSHDDPRYNPRHHLPTCCSLKLWDSLQVQSRSINYLTNLKLIITSVSLLQPLKLNHWVPFFNACFFISTSLQDDIVIRRITTVFSCCLLATWYSVVLKMYVLFSSSPVLFGLGTMSVTFDWWHDWPLIGQRLWFVPPSAFTDWTTDSAPNRVTGRSCLSLALHAVCVLG